MNNKTKTITVHGAQYIRQNKDSFILSWGGVIEAYPKTKCQYNQETQELVAPLKIMQNKFPETDFNASGI